MSSFRLTLPTDIPWERICVSEDMNDRQVCDDRLPAKWQSSLAVFKYRPADDYQMFPKYDISYLKVTATLTGYQPLDQEIQGNIDWDGLDVSIIPGLTDLLNSYNPCHGAILQVTVGPKDDQTPVEKFPFFLDHEPKKRELYELATDTKEKSSRSLESLNITKSAGNTQSTEIIDVDMGGGGVGITGEYSGVQGGINYAAPNGQWGTKRLNSDESLSSRTSDIAQEKRESYSFSTQISQMYHLLDSYHLGTNRVVFFVQPRPHTLEEPSGFVRGPRPVEGIQEFFLIVAQPKGTDDYCISLRLDTSHLTKIPILDYDRRSEPTAVVSASAPVASDKDIPAERLTGQACFIDCWDVGYQCYRTDAFDNFTYTAPDGYLIESYDNLLNDAEHGSSQVVLTPNRKSLNINVQAHGHRCIHDSGLCLDCDDIQVYAGYARRQLQVNLISTEPVRQVGEEEVLMITTRGLCCCTARTERSLLKEMVVGFKPVPVFYRIHHPQVKSTGEKSLKKMESREYAAQSKSCECDNPENRDLPSNYFLIRQVNELSNWIKTESIRSLNDPTVRLQKFYETDFFLKQLERRLIQSVQGKVNLNKAVKGDIQTDQLPVLEKYFGKKIENLRRIDFLSKSSQELAKKTGLTAEQITRIKFNALGIILKNKRR